ncbi:hypothetical protein BDZ97DRAFT_1374259 [Flammula alnicola]|nr:hypothetical protein BDZ97DRAFT_1374259 [Flammula alnicola]
MTHRSIIHYRKMDSCARCQRVDDLKLCSGCRSIKYCSRECQTAHWATHRLACKKKKGKPGLTTGPRSSYPPGQDGADRLPATQPHSAGDPSPGDQQDGADRRSLQMTSLYMSRVDISLRDGRWLQYFSDKPEMGMSELDLSEYIGNNDGKLVWDSSGFHSSTIKANLCNGHVLVARLYRADGSTVVDSWINLDSHIHCDDEVLVYDAERARFGELIWPWTMKEYHVFDSRPDIDAHPSLGTQSRCDVM